MSASELYAKAELEFFLNILRSQTARDQKLLDDQKLESEG